MILPSALFGGAGVAGRRIGSFDDRNPTQLS